MKVRAKISFIALVKRMTISELFASTILKCYKVLENEGYIPLMSKMKKVNIEM